MSTFQVLANNFTFLQGIIMVLVIFFTFFELRRWKTLEGINKNFIVWFSIRSAIMIITFMCVSPIPATCISLLTMVFVSKLGGNFYLSGPENKQGTFFAKQKTLRMVIPREESKQVILWFVIDVFAYLLWVILLPHGLGEILTDKVLFERFF